jgi:hypothetical protein
MSGSPGRTRTCDKAVNSRLLYQLSYRGTMLGRPEFRAWQGLRNACEVAR